MNEANYNHLGSWLPEKIDNLGMSYEQFARMCGLTRSIIYFYMADKNRPTEQTMIRMCQVLGVPPEEGMRQYTPRKVGRPRRLAN